MTGFLIAGTSSGVGKTTVTLAILAVLRRRGLVVQPFKGGPDFLDTMHHAAIAGRPSRNLDTWMLSHAANREIFARATQDADAAVVEGMMGLFDGKHAGNDHGSSAEIARLLGLPIVLVLDAAKAARSVAAIVLGFESFDPRLTFGGVILNNVGSERHEAILREAIGTRCKTPVLGCIRRTPEIRIPERHLGIHALDPSAAPSDLEARTDALAALAERSLDLDALLRLAPAAQSPFALPSTPQHTRDRVRIGVAQDAAFCFTYADNLDLLREAGAEIVPFSPLRDAALPPDLDALYLPGGYPELHARSLAANTPMREAVRHFAASGRPVYAECGGMIYLGDFLTDSEGAAFPMAQVLPLSFAMTPRLVDFGYVSVTTTRPTILGETGLQLRGHSFHYSRIDSAAADLSLAYEIEYSLSGRREQEGFSRENVLATYVHLHFRTAPEIAANFVAAASGARKEQFQFAAPSEQPA